jgi:cation-transporting ATPase E
MSDFTTPPTGLTAEQVRERVDTGRTNAVEERTSRTVNEIVRANVLTRFNAMLSVIALAVLATGRIGDMLFALVLVLNSAIGIIQEVRAKRTLDRLAMLHAPTATVVRDGDRIEVPIAEVVLDDLIEISTGDQVPADGHLSISEGVEIDESNLTGEADAVPKSVGDDVMSGTAVVAGKGYFQARAVGEDAYARQIAAEVKTFRRAHSEIEHSINTLLRYITWVIVAITPFLLWGQFNSLEDDQTWQDAVTGTAAALVGMVPEGLVLLTSLSFGLAALALTRKQVLVQELPAVEGLARVDVVCLDKTGTLTDGAISFDELIVLPGADELEIGGALGAMAHQTDPNPSLAAIGVQYEDTAGWVRSAEVPFSSARKWSAMSFDGHRSWYLGAPDMLLDEEDPLRERVGAMAAEGRRVLLFQRSDSPLHPEHPNDDRRSVALVALGENIRPDAAETLGFFAEQGVTIKVISGDNPTTVAAIGRRLGLDVGEPVDARHIGSEAEDLVDVVEQGTIFGRVSPQQKRSMVRALQANGHTVAMTGDGVNDAMALKDADIGVAMGNAAQATKAASQLVLLDGRFSRMPSVLSEGRRVIGNIERVASFFVAKNTYSLLLAICVTVAGMTYPFLPRHLTLISGVTIGIPAFFLALGPNPTRYRPGFLHRVLLFSLPAGAITGTAIFASYLLARAEDLNVDESRTMATVSALVVALWILAVLARPFKAWKAGLVGTMMLLAVLAFVIPIAQEGFELHVEGHALPGALAIGAVGAAAIEVLYRWVEKAKHETRLVRP